MNKLCWQGLDKWISDKKLAKIVQSLLPDISGVTMARPPKKSFAFLGFPTPELMNDFLQRSTESSDIKKKFKFKQATDDSLIRGKLISEILLPRAFKIIEDSEELGPIRDKITPLWNVPYLSQLSQKKLAVENEYAKFMKEMNIRLKKSNMPTPGWFSTPPSVFDVKPSPITEEYRNKTEFSIGLFDEQTIKVGFTNGKMAAGTLRIESPRSCTNITEQAKDFAERLEKIVVESGVSVFDTRSNSGIWKQAVFRNSTRSGETMASIYINPSPETEKIEGFLAPLFPFYTTVVLITLPETVKVLSGPGYITETILSKTYQVSPMSFFQVNTLGCEVLYQEVVNLVNCDYLLDICCGTGSIGISCAEKVKKIIGIEIVAEAIEDAKKNAEINKVSAEYRVGKAEDLIKEVTKQLQGENIFAVVDPPRNGLHKSILQCLRTTKGLDHIVYVSCNPSRLFNNLADLCCPENNKVKGPAFVPVLIQPVDMFPQTPHIETVVYLKRSTII